MVLGSTGKSWNIINLIVIKNRGRKCTHKRQRGLYFYIKANVKLANKYVICRIF